MLFLSFSDYIRNTWLLLHKCTVTFPLRSGGYMEIRSWTSP